jgi:hypothetical protein
MGISEDFPSRLLQDRMMVTATCSYPYFVGKKQVGFPRTISTVTVTPLVSVDVLSVAIS